VNMRVRGCVRALFALGAIGCLNGTAHCAVVPDLGNKFAFFDEIGNPGNPPPPGSTWTNTYDVSNNIISSTVATANDPVAMTFTQGAGGLTGVPINATLNYSATSVTPYTGTAAPTSFTETFSLDKLTITATGATPGTTAGENLLTIVPVGGAGTGVPSLFGTTGTNATSATMNGSNFGAPIPFSFTSAIESFTDQDNDNWELGWVGIVTSENDQYMASGTGVEVLGPDGNANFWLANFIGGTNGQFGSDIATIPEPGVFALGGAFLAAMSGAQLRRRLRR